MLRASRRRGAKLHRTRTAKRDNDRILQCRHVITFDPELVNVVWNSKRDRFLPLPPLTRWQKTSV